MPSKELIEKVAREICLVTGRMGDPMPIEMHRVDRDWQEHITAAKAAIFAVHAALQEPTPAMQLVVSANWGRRTWAEYQQVLAASALGEQSE